MRQPNKDYPWILSIFHEQGFWVDRKIYISKIPLSLKTFKNECSRTVKMYLVKSLSLSGFVLISFWPCKTIWKMVLLMGCSKIFDPIFDPIIINYQMQPDECWACWERGNLGKEVSYLGAAGLVLPIWDVLDPEGVWEQVVWGLTISPRSVAKLCRWYQLGFLRITVGCVGDRNNVYYKLYLESITLMKTYPALFAAIRWQDGMDAGRAHQKMCVIYRTHQSLGTPELLLLSFWDVGLIFSLWYIYISH